MKKRFLLSVSVKRKLKSVNIWQSYNMKNVHESTTFLLVTLPNIRRFKNIFFTDRLRNKPFLIWLLKSPPYFMYVATLPCNLSLIACFLALMFHKVVWQHIQGVMKPIITALLQIY